MSKKMNCKRKKPLLKYLSFEWGAIFLFFTLLAGIFIAGCSEDKILQQPADVDILAAAGIQEILPANLSDSVALDPEVSVTFIAGTDAAKVAATTLTLNNGGAQI